MAAHWDYVRSWRPPREIHVRLDLPSRFSSRRYYEYQRESRLRPDSRPRVLDPVEVCSRRNRLLDERHSSPRTVLRGRSRLQTESWRLCSRGLHRNNPRRHPFRNSTSITCPLVEVLGNRSSLRSVRSQHWLRTDRRLERLPRPSTSGP